MTFRYPIILIFSFSLGSGLWGQFIEDFESDFAETPREIYAEDMDLNRDGILTSREILDYPPRGRLIIFLPKNSQKDYRYCVETTCGNESLQKVAKGIEEGISYKSQRNLSKRIDEIERTLIQFNLAKIYGEEILNDPDLEKVGRLWINEITPGTFINLPTEEELFLSFVIVRRPEEGFIKDFRDIDRKLNESRIAYAIDPDYRYTAMRMRFSFLSWLDYALHTGIRYKKDTLVVDNFFAKVNLVHPFGDVLTSYYTLTTENVTSIGGSIFLPWRSIGMGIGLGGVWYYHTVSIESSDYNSWLVNTSLYLWSSKRFFPSLFLVTVGWEGSTSNDNKFTIATSINQSFYAISIGAKLQQETIETPAQEQKLLRVKTAPFCKVRLSTPSFHSMGLSIEGKAEPSTSYYTLSVGIYWK